MKLSFDTIKSVTVGAVDITQQNDGIHFAKCTQKQIEVWYSLAQHLGDNATATTGIRLDMHTNSRTFKFTAPQGNRFEIYVNGVFMYNIPATELLDRSYSIDLSGEDNRVTLILPSHAPAAVLSVVEIDDGAYVKPHEFNKKIFFIGDSITQGWNSGYDSLSYAYRVSDFFNAHSIIQGVGGGDFRGLFDPEIDYDPDLVIVAYGTNDWSHASSLEELLNNADTFLTALTKKYPATTLVGLLPIWRDVSANPTRPAGTFEDTCLALKKKFTEYGLTVIDGQKLTPHISDFFSDKTLHPNAMGFGIYAENLIKEIKDLL